MSVTITTENGKTCRVIPLRTSEDGTPRGAVVSLPPSRSASCSNSAPRLSQLRPQ